jgi:hypothetical protein
MMALNLSRYALCSCVAVAILTGCGGSQSPIASSALARSGPAVPPGRSAERSLHGHYLAEFTTVAGSGLPESSFCLKFTSSGTWSSPPTSGGGLNGTYGISGKQLFASAIGPWSPPVYMSLQGSVNAKQGSGDYIVMQQNGDLFSGGTFTMTRKQNNTCS